MKIFISIVGVVIIAVGFYVLTSGSRNSDSILVNMQNYKQVITNLIQSGKDADICDKVIYSPDDFFWNQSEAKPKDICYRDFAVAKKDISICNNIFNKLACIDQVNSLIKSDSNKK